LGLDVLVEIHDEHELDAALAADANLIGVNQRDLVTFQVDHERAVRMAGVIPDHVVKVAESGVRGPDDARSLRAAGYHAVLVGETLVTPPTPPSCDRSAPRGRDGIGLTQSVTSAVLCSAHVREDLRDHQ
jgi:indole-3-glycerol phosphate synthase